MWGINAEISYLILYFWGVSILDVSGVLDSLCSELETGGGSRCEALNTRHRVSQLRLLSQLCGAMSPDTDTATVIRCLDLTLASVRQQGEECQAGLAVLSQLLTRMPGHPQVRR